VSANGTLFRQDGGFIYEAQYSPTGRFLAMWRGGSQLEVVDFDTGRVLAVSPSCGSGARDHQFNSPVWLSDTRLLVSEQWQTPEQAELSKERIEPPYWIGEMGWSIIDITKNSTETYHSRGTNGADFAYVPVGALSDERWVIRGVSDGSSLLRFFHPSTSTLGDSILVAADPEKEQVQTWSYCWPWVAKYALTGSYPALKWLVSYQNVLDGRAMEVANVPPGRAALITADGRYVIAAEVESSTSAHRPVIIDTDSGQRSTPPDEFWEPIAISEARGVLLVGAGEPSEEGGGRPNWAYYEVPLASLLPR
jgi:hypothetical protein